MHENHRFVAKHSGQVLRAAKAIVLEYNEKNPLEPRVLLAVKPLTGVVDW